MAQCLSTCQDDDLYRSEAPRNLLRRASVARVNDLCMICGLLYFSKGEVQLGQRVALIGMLEKQKGHSFVVGAGGTFGACILAIGRTMKKKRTAATIKKVII